MQGDLKQGVFSAKSSKARRLQCREYSSKESSLEGALMQGVVSVRRSHARSFQCFAVASSLMVRYKKLQTKSRF